MQSVAMRRSISSCSSGRSRAFSLESGEKSVSSYWKSMPSAKRGLGPVGADDARGVETVPLLENRGEVLVEVVGGVGKGGEEENFAVAGIDGRGDLAEDVVFQVLEFGVVGRRDLLHLLEQGLDHAEVGAQVVLP